MNWFSRTEAKRDVASPDECFSPADVSNFFAQSGYPDVWLESTESGVIVHGIELGHDEGGEEIVVPESWMNKY